MNYNCANIDTSNNSVKGAECTCPAEQGPSGSCKHIAAFCLALEDFVRTRDKLEVHDTCVLLSCSSGTSQENGD